ncbi:MAG TPA: glycosyltransferase family 2 protein [Geothrix sp.]|nr:glycosyltransferase family 2 protein [Geothrix sp.]
MNAPLVGITVLNYRQPAATLACVNRLLEKEPGSSRILWLENDSERTREEVLRVLGGVTFPWVELDGSETTLPPSGTVGVIFNPSNLGYAAGNNVGLRLLHRAGVPFVWILNNDTQLSEGSSADLVAAALTRPAVGSWGTRIAEARESYSGAKISLRDFAPSLADGIQAVESEPTSYISGCSLFMRLEVAAAAGFLPEDYFLYYEDTAFGFELRRRGLPPSVVESVKILHSGSLSSGRRSPMMEYYMRRNRWVFIQRYFPEAMRRQQWRIFYTLQKYLLRFRLDRIRTELAAWRDFRANRLDRTDRVF